MADDKTEKTDKAKTVRVKKDPVLCMSGSGLLTSKTFAPGKDARFKSDLIETALNGPLTGAAAKAEKERLQALGYSPQFIKEDASRLVSSERAVYLLEERGWTHFLDRKREILATKEAKAAAAADAKVEREAEKAKQKAEKAAATKVAREKAAAEAEAA